MSATMASSIPDHFALLQLQSFSQQPRFCSGRCLVSQKSQIFQLDALLWGRGKQIPPRLSRELSARACFEPTGGGNRGVTWREKSKIAVGVAVDRLQGAVGTIPHVALTVKKSFGSNYAIGFLSLALTIFAITVRKFMVGKARQRHHGSVAELVRRGQLRSDRRGISKPLKYEDPFNNPLVKKSKSNTTVEICGKVYRLAPVTLTEEQQSSHQKRRSRAYKWKRPTIFLKEGEDVPPDVDPDTVQWVPTNHPFATTVSDIDENLAQNNVFQKDGVPFRIRVEHEEMQRKLEALQSDQKLDNLAISPNSFRAFDRPSNSTLKQTDPNSSNGDQSYDQIQRIDHVDFLGSGNSNLSDGMLS